MKNDFEKLGHPLEGVEGKKQEFDVEVRFPPEFLLDRKIEESKEKALLASLVIDAEGNVKVKEGRYKYSSTPYKDIDIADWDYDDARMAEHYDKSPEIILHEIDLQKADELLLKRQEELEGDLGRIDREVDEAEDEWDASRMEEPRSSLEHDLGQVKKLRQKIKERLSK